MIESLTSNGRAFGLRKGAVSSLALTALLVAGSACAQNAADDLKIPDISVINALGIDMANDAYVRNDTFLTIGDPSAGGLAWTYRAYTIESAGDFRGYINYKTSGTEYYVRIGDSVVSFIPNGTSSLTNGKGTGATLTTFVNGSNTGYIYTDDGGTIYTFGTYLAALGTWALTSVKKPDGTYWTVNGTASGDCSAHSTTCSFAFNSVVSNTGFAMKFSNTVTAVNWLAHGCSFTAFTCAYSDNSITVDGNVTDTSMGAGGAFQITDPMGGQWRYRTFRSFGYADPDPTNPDPTIIHGPRKLWAFKDPTGYLVTMTRRSAIQNGIIPDGRITSFTDQRGTFTFTSGTGSNSDVRTITFNGTQVYIVAGVDSIAWYKDGINRQTSFGIADYVTSYDMYDGAELGTYTRLLSKTMPEGDYVTYDYDSRGNVWRFTRAAVPGSGLANKVITGSYPTTCTTLITCNKPTWVKDALGNQTDFTYDSTHGGVLTMTLPLDQDNLRKKTFNTYSTFNTGNGNIYRLTRSETCGLTSTQLSTLTACPAAVTTSVTTTDYGNATTAPYTYMSFQPLSVTQTDGASTLTATTTYGYDILGNVVMVDGPRTDVDDKSYKTYDLNRRVVCEISPDPDGTVTTLSRIMVRHVYDAAGRETETDTGTGTSTTGCTPGTEMTRASYKLMTYDAVGRLVKTETKVTS